MAETGAYETREKKKEMATTTSKQQRDLQHLRNFTVAPAWWKSALPQSHTIDDVPYEVRYVSLGALEDYVATLADGPCRAYLEAVLAWRKASARPKRPLDQVDGVASKSPRKTVKLSDFADHVVARLHTLLADTAVQPKTTLNVYKSKLAHVLRGHYAPDFQGVVAAIGPDFGRKLRECQWSLSERKRFNGQVIAPLNHLKKDAGLDAYLSAFFAAKRSPG